MAHLLDLHEELLILILGSLYQSRGPLLALRNANLVCRRFHNIATELLFKCVSVDLAQDFRCWPKIGRRHKWAPEENSIPPKSHHFIEFLLQSSVRSSVREVLIPLSAPSHGHWSWRAVALFTELLMQLPSLQSIRFGAQDGRCLLMADHLLTPQTRIGGDPYDYAEFPCVSQLVPQRSTLTLWLVDVIRNLEAPVQLRIDCLHASRDYWCSLEELSTISSLRVQLGKFPYGNHPCCSGRSPPPYPAVLPEVPTPSTVVSRIVRNNPTLTKLHLRVWPCMDAEDEDEARHTLEGMRTILPQIRTLELEGKVRTADVLWEALDIPNLQELALCNIDTIVAFSTNCAGRFWNLRCLRLSTQRVLRPDGPVFPDGLARGHGPPPSNTVQQALKSLFSGLRLGDLILWYFDIEVLHNALCSVGASLRHLRFRRDYYSSNGAAETRTLDSSATESILSLDYVRKHCPLLEEIGLDLERRHLVSMHQVYNAVEQRWPPDLTKGHHTRPSVAFFPQCRDIFAADSLAPLDSLALFPSLKHISLIIQWMDVFSQLDNRPHDVCHNVTCAEAIATFVYLRGRKRGVALESLSISCNHKMQTVWENGPLQCILILFEDGHSRVEQVWDIRTFSILEEKKKADWTAKPRTEWGMERFCWAPENKAPPVDPVTSGLTVSSA